MGLLYVHIVAGLAAVTAGLVALFARKGGHVHRRAGALFSIAMLALAGSGVIVAIRNFTPSAPINLLTSAIVTYMVVSSIIAIRLPPVRSVDAITFSAALTIVVASFFLGIDAAAVGWDLPTPMFFVFGGFALFAALGDLRRLTWAGQRSNRIARHLWRMGFALFFVILGASGQANKVLAEPLRQRGLLAGLALCVLVAVPYWLIRLLRGAVPPASKTLRQ